MRRGIRHSLPLVMPTSNNNIVHDNHSPNRHFSTLQGQADRKSTRLNSSHTEIYTLSLHDALPICGIRHSLPLVMPTSNNNIVHDNHSPNRHFSTLQGQ